MTIHNKVFDLSALLSQDHGALADPLIERAGTDCSEWFSLNSDGEIDLRTFCDPVTNLTVPYIPQGRFVHVPQIAPSTSQSTDYEAPWWKDSQYVVGTVTKRAHRIRVVNTLTSQEHLVEFGVENTVEEMQKRYLEWNAHCGSYTWKALVNGEFRPLDIHRTLEQNGVPIVADAEELERLGLSEDEPDLIPTLCIAFNDDLTVA